MASTTTPNVRVDRRGQGENPTPYPFHAIRMRKAGKSFVIAIPPIVRKALGLLPGDYVGLRIVGTRCVLNRLNPRVVSPLSNEEKKAAGDEPTRAR